MQREQGKDVGAFAHHGAEIVGVHRTIDCHSPTRDGKPERDEFITRLRTDPRLFEQLSAEERWQARERVAEYKRNHPIRTIADLNRLHHMRHLAHVATRDHEADGDQPIRTLHDINARHHACFAGRRA